jgi:galacturan 1,4-alpha-galacturonidase
MKSWTASIHGTPPTGGGGGNGTVTNVTLSSVVLDEVDIPVHIYQTNGGSSSDTPSFFQFADITYKNWSGTADTNTS